MGNLVNKRFTIKQITDLLKESEERLKKDIIKEQQLLSEEELRLVELLKAAQSPPV